MSERRSVSSRVGWLAAEFMVVVLGVVVGLAVDSWRQSQDDLAVEIGYLERLRADLIADTVVFTDATRLDRGRSEAVLASLDALGRGEGVPPDSTSAMHAFLASLAARYELPRTGAWEELVSQGDLGRIGDAEVRELLSEYHSEPDRLARQFGEWQEASSRVEFILIERLDPVLYRWVQSSGSVDTPVSTGNADYDLTRAQIEGAWASLGADAEMRNLFYRHAQVQRRLATQHEEWTDYARALIERLDSRLAELGASS